MNNYLKTTSLLLLGAAAFSCSKPSMQDQLQSQDERVKINNNQADLNTRVHLRNERLNLNTFKAVDPVDLTLVADVDAPVVNGLATVATHIQFEGDKVYVTYHTVDDPYGGAIEVFDVVDPDNPVLISSLEIVDTDYHNLDIVGTSLYVGGARDIYASGYSFPGHKGAIAQKIVLAAGLLTPPSVEVPLASYATTSISGYSSGILASTGDLAGEAYLLDPSSLAVLDSEPKDDVKYINGNGSAGYFAMVATDGAVTKLIIYSGTSFTASSKIEVVLGSYDVTEVGKNAVQTYADHVLVNLGDDGLFKVDRHTGTILKSFLNTGGDGIAIAAVEYGDYTLLAHGCDGLIVLDKDYNKVAEYKTGVNGSANYINTNGDVVFIAAGREGIQILRNTPKVCDLEHIADGSVNRSFWFELYHPSTSQNQAFAWVGGQGNFVQNPDGTAQVTGTIVSLKNANDKWEVTLNLSDRKTWAEWSALGRSYMHGAGYVPGSHEDWFYYIMDPTPGNESTLVGLGDNAGVTKELQHKPIGLKYGFQLGYGGNAKNGDYGLGGWFSYLNSNGDRRTGDINVNVTGC